MKRLFVLAIAGVFWPPCNSGKHSIWLCRHDNHCDAWVSNVEPSMLSGN